MGSLVQFARSSFDSLTNLVSRLGTDRDKAAATIYGLTTLTDDQILAAYKTAWLPRKIVDIPAFDSVRAWRDWQAKPDQIEAIEAEEKRLGVKAKVLLARKRARLWGGAAILIGTGDANTEAPIDVERVTKGGLRYLAVFNRRQLTGHEIERDPESEWFGKPKLYQLQSTGGQVLGIHPSRLVIFTGNEPADEDLDASAQQGWGDSVLQSTLDAIKQADSTAANVASLVFEAKVDIIRVPNFMQGLGSEEYRQRLIERYTLAATAKGINGTLMLDKEEEYETKQASFATLPDVMDRFLQIVSGAADIPATRLLGQSPAGMNATGESDLRNYYDRLSAAQELEMEPAMSVLDECIIRSATGARDKDIHYQWAPLWGMSEKEKADVFKTKADAARVIAGSGQQPIIPIEALSDSFVNAMVEDGSLPGLEAAIEEYGTLAEQEPSLEEQAAAAALEQQKQQQASGQQEERRPTGDAASRTLYVSRKVKNGADILAWAKAQGFESTLPAEDLHVTITYSRSAVDWMTIGEAWQSEMKLPAGGPRLMERFGEATVLLFKSTELEWRHEIMREAGASWDHAEYQPHITISYADRRSLDEIEPYQGEIVLGPEIFAEVDEDWTAGVSEESRGASVDGATFRRSEAPAKGKGGRRKR